MCLRIIYEIKPKAGFEMLVKAKEGLCISRYHPDYLRYKYGMSQIEICWLSAVGGKNTLKANSIAQILTRIKRFARTHPHADVLLDGVEYLLLYNSKNAIIEFLEAVIEMSKQMKFTFILHADPNVLSADREICEIFDALSAMPSEKLSHQTFQAGALPAAQTLANKLE